MPPEVPAAPEQGESDSLFAQVLALQIGPLPGVALIGGGGVLALLGSCLMLACCCRRRRSADAPRGEKPALTRKRSSYAKMNPTEEIRSFVASPEPFAVVAFDRIKPPPPSSRPPPPPPSSQQLATGWVEMGMSDGRVFYYHEASGHSQWERPAQQYC